MIRIKSGKNTQKRHKRKIKLARSFKGSQSKLFKISNQRIMKALKNSYSDRRKKKTYYRRIWINRINIFCNNNKSNFNNVKNTLKKNNILINTKILSNLCILDPYATKKLTQL